MVCCFVSRGELFDHISKSLIVSCMVAYRGGCYVTSLISGIGDVVSRIFGVSDRNVLWDVCVQIGYVYTS